METVNLHLRRQIVLDTDPVKREQVLIRPKGECIDAPPYKDSVGNWRTTSLFYETFPNSKWEKYTPIFSLGEFPIPLLPSYHFYDRFAPDKDIPERHPVPSLRQIYLQYNDPTEYQFSIDVFKSTYHWKHLQRLKWFKPYLEEWRATLGEKLRGTGIRALVDIATGSDPKLALNAAKWLANGEFKEKQLKGRPTVERVNTELNREVAIERIYREDAARLGVEIPTAAPEGSLQEESLPELQGTGIHRGHSH